MRPAAPPSPVMAALRLLEAQDKWEAASRARKEARAAAARRTKPAKKESEPATPAKKVSNPRAKRAGAKR